MKIIIVGSAYPFRGGGITSYNERLAEEFRRQGHEVCIYTFSLQYPGFLFPGTTQYATEPSTTTIDICIKINSVNPLNWIKVGRELKRERPDLIVIRYWLPFFGPCFGTLLRIAKKNNHTRVVCIADNIVPHEKRPGDVLFTRYFVKPVDAFITMSEKVLADLKQFAPRKPATFVVHPLYDNFGEKTSKVQARQQLGLEADIRIALFFGFIRRYKGLDLLLEAIHLLKTQYPPEIVQQLKFLIAGEFYEDRKFYEEQIRRLDIADKLILKTHFIADSEVKYYLCAADVVIQPYRSATQSGVTPLAYHFEIPMIVTNVGGLASLVPDGKAGLIAEPTPLSIAAKIVEYFTKGEAHFLPGLREEKIKYSWQKMTDAILHFAEEHSS